MVYPIEKRIIPPIYNLWLRNTEGLENVPKIKPFIMAMNHASYYDALLLPSILLPKINRKIHPLVNSYYWKNFLVRMFLDHHEAIPVYIKKSHKPKKDNNESFNKALNYLKKNEIIMIFPEGKRSSDGNLRKAYVGVARLALNSKVPVLPIGIIGSDKVLPKGKVFPRFKRCQVKIGKLIYFNKYYNKKIDNSILENITRIIMKKIAELIEKKYNY